MKGQMDVYDCIDVAENEQEHVLAERLKYARGFVNARRKEAGLRATSRLSKGYTCVPGLCCTAQSLRAVSVRDAYHVKDRVVLVGWTLGGELRQREWCDPEMTQFMRDFDSGLYPELIKKPTVVKINGKPVA